MAEGPSGNRLPSVVTPRAVSSPLDGLRVLYLQFSLQLLPMGNEIFDIFVSYERADWRHATDIVSILQARGGEKVA
jgi:hypothetical protein